MARILVVDDQKISRLTLAGLLGDANHDVRAEASGAEGIEAARTWVPDVIILDVHMPEMDGFDVVARLKQDPLTEAIPVVFLTGDPPTDELIVRGLDLGAYDFLSKGCSKAELLARVSVMERIKRNHDELSAIARISDTLLQSVEPEALARRFIQEARHVFRADGVVLAIERRGESVMLESAGIEGSPDDLVHMLKAVGSGLRHADAARAEVLEPAAVREQVDPYLGTTVTSAAVACVRRDPVAALVVVMSADDGAFRSDVDAPLLKTLSSQAAIAIEHAMLTERARRQARELERAMTERSRFFASLSHELRTPINAVIGYNHLLQEQVFGTLSDRQTEALDKANRSAQHLLELVDDILDISKIEAGKLEMYPETVELGALLRDTSTSVQLQAQEKGIELDVIVDESARIETDPARVRQIILNLLSNAVKFTDEGRVEMRLMADDENAYRIRVVDTGEGISAEDIERIFDEFEQAGAGARRGGTGLGLAISRRLAELLGGSLRVESEVGRGSTFALTLPREWDPQQRPAGWDDDA